MSDITNTPAYLYVAGAFPRIGAAIKLFWGEPEFVPYVEKLLNDTRDGARQGFPQQMVVALHNLLERHNLEYPQFSPSQRMSLWQSNLKIR